MRYRGKSRQKATFLGAHFVAHRHILGLKNMLLARRKSLGRKELERGAARIRTGI
jgi:hypothetical protein